MVKEEIEHKGTVGEHFIDDAGARLNALLEYIRFKAKQEYGVEQVNLKKKDLDALLKQKNISPNVVFTDKNEIKFFKLLGLLVKNSEENQGRLKPILKYMKEYREAVVESHIQRCTRQLESDRDSSKEQHRHAARSIKHYSEVAARIKSLQ